MVMMTRRELDYSFTKRTINTNLTPFQEEQTPHTEHHLSSRIAASLVHDRPIARLLDDIIFDIQVLSAFLIRGNTTPHPTPIDSEKHPLPFHSYRHDDNQQRQRRRRQQQQYSTE